MGLRSGLAGQLSKEVLGALPPEQPVLQHPGGRGSPVLPRAFDFVFSGLGDLKSEC